MKIATILPTNHLGMEVESDYHLLLAHHVDKDPSYASFFKIQAAAGRFVIMDNGVVEEGVAMNLEELSRIADIIKCSEMILPDTIYESSKTLRMSLNALVYMRNGGSPNRSIRLMAVPQGDTPEKWINCVKEMLTWDVDTIGISRFLVPKIFSSRYLALCYTPELINSDKDIHLLGCPKDPSEVAFVNNAFPGRIRGVDSGIAAIYTQSEKALGETEKPKEIIDLDARLDEKLLRRNVSAWKDGCQQRISFLSL